MKRLVFLFACGSLAALVSLACGAFDGAAAEPTDAGAETSIVEDASQQPPPVACDPGKLDTDPLHCGRCGHGCLGGACQGGVCQPFVLATQPIDAPVVDLVVESSRVIWIAYGAVEGSATKGLYTCPKTGCAGAPEDLAGTRSPGNLGSDGKDKSYVSFVYGGVNAIFQIEAGGVLSKLPPTHASARQFAVRPDGFFYVGVYEPDGGTGRIAYRWDGAQESLVGVFLPPAGENTFPAAYTSDRVFFGSINSGFIASCPLPSGAFTPFTTAGFSNVSAMTATSDRVFWSDTITLRSCASGPTCAAQRDEVSETDLGGKPLGATVAKGELFIQTSAGELVACDPTSCKSTRRTIVKEPELSVQFAAYGHSVTADDDAIYYAASDPDAAGRKYRIMKLAK